MVAAVKSAAELFIDRIHRDAHFNLGCSSYGLATQRRLSFVAVCKAVVFSGTACL